MTSGTLHIVFGSSPAGIVRRALSDLGRREMVLDLMDNLSLGPIAFDDPKIRGSWFSEELGEFDWWEVASEDVALPARSTAGDNRLIAWYAPNRAESYAGFEWWLSLVGTTPVSIMSVPDLHFYSSDAIVKLIGQEIDLSNEDRNRHLAEWQRLKGENALLRIVKDDNLISAPLNYFDELIIGYVSNKWQPVMRIVGKAFSTIGIETGHFIDDLFTRSRLRALHRLGAIEWDGDKDDIRGSKVRLAGTN